jgi:hypothetical protein
MPAIPSNIIHPPRSIDTNLGIKTVSECNNVCMGILDKLAHDLQLSIFESLVFFDFFNGHHLVGFHYLSFKGHSKRAISNDPLYTILMFCSSSTNGEMTINVDDERVIDNFGADGSW